MKENSFGFDSLIDKGLLPNCCIKTGTEIRNPELILLFSPNFAAIQASDKTLLSLFTHTGTGMDREQNQVNDWQINFLFLNKKHTEEIIDIINKYSLWLQGLLPFFPQLINSL